MNVALGGDLPNNKKEEKESFRYTVIHKETGAKHNIVVECKNPDDGFDEVVNKINGTCLVNWNEKDGTEITEIERECSWQDYMSFWDEFKITQIERENKS